MNKIITTLKRPRLENAVLVWSVHEKKDVRKLVRIQRIAIKMASELSSPSYKTRLGELSIPTL